jgi:hypothetical protein
MLLEQETLCASRTSISDTSKTSKSPTRVVYIVTDTCYPTSADFNLGKGVTTIDSVHTSTSAANGRAKKIMFARTNPGDSCQLDPDKILEEIKDELYTGIGLGESEEKGCYARKCEVERKPVDVDEDGSSEEEQDMEDWNLG